MKLRIILIILAVLGFTYVCNAQNSYTYYYDGAGNRISRRIVYMTPTPETTETDTTIFTENNNSNGKTQDDRSKVEDVFMDNTEISIFPNPTADRLNVNFSNIDIEGRIMLQVFDINGRLLKTQQANNLRNKIDFSRNSAGTYILRIISGDDKKEYTIIKN
ncbi:MAG: T9SS type A sorting domain-containing protein [bacterium]|nr:T9SS type A sorting domain-containing protein [bacterium]